MCRESTARRRQYEVPIEEKNRLILDAMCIVWKELDIKNWPYTHTFVDAQTHIHIYQ